MFFYSIKCYCVKLIQWYYVIRLKSQVSMIVKLYLIWVRKGTVLAKVNSHSWERLIDPCLEWIFISQKSIFNENQFNQSIQSEMSQ